MTRRARIEFGSPWWRVVLALGCLLVAVGAEAQVQVPANPRAIEFESPDYALVLEFEVGFFLSGAAAPVTSANLGKPPIKAGTTMTVAAAIDVRPLTTLGQYEMRIRARGGTAGSPGPWTVWAAGGADGSSPVPFSRALLPVVNLRVVP